MGDGRQRCPQARSPCLSSPVNINMMGWSLPELGKRDFLKDVMKVFNHFSSLKRSFLIGPELLKGICTLEMEEVVETYSC